MNKVKIVTATDVWDWYSGEIKPNILTHFMAAAILQGMTYNDFFKLAGNENAMRHFVLAANGDGTLTYCLSSKTESVCGPLAKEEQRAVLTDGKRRKEIIDKTKELTRSLCDIMPKFFGSLLLSNITWGQGVPGVFLQNITENDNLLRAMIATARGNIGFRHTYSLNYESRTAIEIKELDEMDKQGFPYYLGMQPTSGTADNKETLNVLIDLLKHPLNSRVEVIPCLERHFTYDEIRTEIKGEIGRSSPHSVSYLIREDGKNGEEGRISKKIGHYFVIGNYVATVYYEKNWVVSLLPLEGFIFRKRFSIVCGVPKE